MSKEKSKSANNKKSSGQQQQQITSSSALNAKDSVRDYKTITSSTSTNFNKIEARLERDDLPGNENDSPTGDDKKGKIKRNSSLISLKSINQNLKAMLKITRNDTSSSSDAEVGEVNKKRPLPLLNPPLISAPSLRIDDVEFDETKMLLNYPQSPQRYPSSSSASVTPAVTPTTSTTPLLQYQEYVPRSVSPSPYLSISPSPRRSSTSDILNKKPVAGAAPATPIAVTPVDGSSKKSLHAAGSHSGSGSGLIVDPNLLNVNTRERRPSTSELLRKARERKGSEGKLGRSISSGSSIARCGGNRNRRLSMAF